jgi:hypothetical protein
LITVEIELVNQNVVLQRAAAKRENFRAAYVLSTIVTVLSAGVSVIGLLFPGVYRSTGWGNGTSLGNDLVTLVVAVPVLALAIIYSARGSVRARLLWLGALYYMLYNYAFYVFGMPVTKLYLLIIAAFTLSGLALALGMFNLDVEAISRRFSPRTPGKPIAVYLFYVAAMISFLWISRWVKFLLTGQVPDVNGSQNAYQVIAAVDLSFMVSLQIPAAYLLWTRRPWGYVFSVVAFVQGAMYTAVMAVICVFGWILRPGSHLFSGWFINCLVGCTLSLLCLAGLLLSVKRAQTTNQ